MSAYRRISKEDYLERKHAGATNIGWAEGVGYYVEDRQALEEFWKQSDAVKKRLTATPLERIDLLCEQHELYTKDELVSLIQKVICSSSPPKATYPEK